MEDRYQEDGMIDNIILCSPLNPKLVHYGMRFGDVDPRLGNDRHLDKQDRVGSNLLLFLPSDDTICLPRRFHNAWEFWVYSVVYGLIVGPNYSILQTMMSELTPPGFEYMVGIALWSQLSASYSHHAAFRFIWTVQSLRINSWTECDPSDS